jgi:hypothetical protein
MTSQIRVENAIRAIPGILGIQNHLVLDDKLTHEVAASLTEQCVATNPNVRGVINNIHISGAETELQARIFSQPTLGETIYFLDGISGVVKHMIIAPNNRRVVAMTVWGQFADQLQGLKSLNSAEVRPPKRLIVISMDLVRYLTKVSGCLYINSNEREQYTDFDPASFHAPNVDWTPPYPYCPDDVLFPVENGRRSIKFWNDLLSFH